MRRYRTAYGSTSSGMLITDKFARQNFTGYHYKKTADYCGEHRGVNRTLYGFSVVSAYCVRYYYICTEGYTYKQVEYQPDYRAVRSDGGNRGRLAAPVKFPTTAISEALKSCSSIAVAATGSANRGSLFHIGPFIISICYCF